MDNNQIENTQLMKNEIDEYFSKRFLIQKKQWYNLIINIQNNNQGLIKIFDDNKNQIFLMSLISNNSSETKSDLSNWSFRQTYHPLPRQGCNLLEWFHLRT